jgi:hypothetical protein
MEVDSFFVVWKSSVAGGLWSWDVGSVAAQELEVPAALRLSYPTPELVGVATGACCDSEGSLPPSVVGRKKRFHLKIVLSCILACRIKQRDLSENMIRSREVVIE